MRSHLTERQSEVREGALAPGSPVCQFTESCTQERRGRVYYAVGLIHTVPPIFSTRYKPIRSLFGPANRLETKDTKLVTLRSEGKNKFIIKYIGFQ